MSTRVATIRAYRKASAVVVTVDRGGCRRRYRVTLKRYRALRHWLQFFPHRWAVSGAWGSRSFTASLWAEEVTRPG